MSLQVGSTSSNYALRTTNNINHNQPYTWMGWVDLVSDLNAFGHIYSALGDATSTHVNADWLGTNVDGTALRWASYVASAGSASVGPQLTVGVPVHVALIRQSATSLIMVVGGVQIGSPIATDVTARAVTQREQLGLFNTLPAPVRLSGMKQWQAALTIAEVKQEMACIRPVRFADLHSWHPAISNTVAGLLKDNSGKNRNWTQQGTLTIGRTSPPVPWGVPPHRLNTLRIVPNQLTGALVGSGSELVASLSRSSGTVPTLSSLTAEVTSRSLRPRLNIQFARPMRTLSGALVGSAGGLAGSLAKNSTLPTWVQSLSVGQWYEIPSSAMSSVHPNPVPPGVNGPQSKLLTWNSLSIDTRTSKIYSVAGGGHNDYAGNEVNVFDVERESPVWSELLASSLAANIVANQTYYNDGRPVSRHTYYGACCIEQDDRIMIYGGSLYSNGNMFRATDSYNLIGNNYNPAGTHPDCPVDMYNVNTGWYAPATVKIVSTGDVYGFNNNKVAKWTRSTNSWGLVTTSGATPPHGAEAMSAHDTTRNRILVVGGPVGPAQHHFNVATNAVTQVTLTGTEAATVTGTQKGAMVYVPAIDKFLVRRDSAGGTVYQIDPATFAVSIFATTGGGTIPANGAGAGPYNKFLYAPNLQGIVYLPVYGNNCWFLRVHV